MADATGRGLARRAGDRMVGWIVRGLFALLRALGPDASSALGGAVARTIGPFLGASRVALANLERFMPQLDARARRRVLREVWDNLGRTGAEFPHLARLAAERTELVGGEVFERIRASGRGAIFFCAHTGNWEIAPPTARRFGVFVNVVYRAMSNPHVDAIVLRERGSSAESAVAKGAAGARRLVALAAEGRHIAVLLDQKMNDGIPAPFFGVDAMTAPAPAQLALRHKLPLVPVRIERLGGARFRMTVQEPLPLPASGDRRMDVEALVAAVNATIECWVRERPGEWLWLHRRWPAPAPGPGSKDGGP